MEPVNGWYLFSRCGPSDIDKTIDSWDDEGGRWCFLSTGRHIIVAYWDGRRWEERLGYDLKRFKYWRFVDIPAPPADTWKKRGRGKESAPGHPFPGAPPAGG